MVLPAEPRQTSPREVIEEAPSNWLISILPGISRTCGIPMRRRWIFWRRCWAVGGVAGFSARCARRKGLVTSADAWTYSPGEQGLFGMSAVTTADKFQRGARGVAVGSRAGRRMKRRQRNGIGEGHQSVCHRDAFTRKTMQGQAQDLGGELDGGERPEFLRTLPCRGAKCHAGDVQRVAREYLTASNRTLYGLLPQGTRRSTAKRSGLRRIDGAED